MSIPEQMRAMPLWSENQRREQILALFIFTIVEGFALGFIVAFMIWGA